MNKESSDKGCLNFTLLFTNTIKSNEAKYYYTFKRLCKSLMIDKISNLY